jgi:hypothetical protein
MGKNRIFGMIGFVALLGVGARMADAEPVTLAVSTPVAVRTVEQSIAIPTTTQTPTTTTVAATTTTVPEVVAQVVEQPPASPVPPYKNGSDKMCWEWLDLAREVGWPEEELSKLGYIMYRESRCQNEAWNRDDPTPDGSRGLTQINGFWCRPSKYNPDGYLQTFHPGLLPNGVCSDLHDPEVNLRAALALYDYGVERGNNPWTPWGG